MGALHRLLVVPALASAALLCATIPASAQGFGIGGRFAFVRADTNGDDDSHRFVGGHIRLTGDRAGLEVSIDRHSEEFDSLDQRVKETPVQVSLLLFLARGGFKPYLLGGPGWYKTTVEPLSGGEGESTREFGWHAGFGAEIRGGRHFGVHADYRYTFLDFNDDDDDDGLIGGLLPSHGGSMWTAGVTIYF